MATTCTSNRYCFLQNVAAKKDQTPPAVINELLNAKQAVADLLSITCLKPVRNDGLTFWMMCDLFGTKKNAKNTAAIATGNTYHARYERQPPLLAAKPAMANPIAIESIPADVTIPIERASFNWQPFTNQRESHGTNDYCSDRIEGVEDLQI